MLPDDEDLIATLRIIETWTDRAGLICTTDKDTVRSRMRGRSPNAFDALKATFMPDPVATEYMTGSALIPL